VAQGEGPGCKPKNRKKKSKGLFRLAVSEVSVYGQLVPLLLGLWWGRASWQRAHAVAKREEGAENKIHP
jgi:hypothetical protein